MTYPHANQKLYTLLAISSLLIASCVKQINETTTSEGTGVPQGPSEKAYCGFLPSLTFGGGITLTGNAKYLYRVNGNGAVAGAGRAIRSAEVRVTNGSGNLVQCAETDSSGNYSFQLPSDNATYTVAIISRALNSHLQASVLDKPETN